MVEDASHMQDVEQVRVQFTWYWKYLKNTLQLQKHISRIKCTTLDLVT